MYQLSFMQFLRALPVSLAIVAAIWTLAVLFALVLPSFDSAFVQRSDREVLADLHRLAVMSTIAAALSGAVLGCLVPVAVRWARRRKAQMKPGA